MDYFRSLLQPTKMETMQIIGNFQLISAIWQEDLPKIKDLIDSGADINFVNLYNNNNTPLHDAVTSGNPEIVEMLLAAGASPTAKNDRNQDPVDLCSRLENKKREIIRAIFNHSKQTAEKMDIDQDFSTTTFYRRHGTTAVGQYYETKLLSMVLFRLLHDDQIKNFYLGNNLDEAGMFDDIVLRTIDAGGKSQVYCLQTRHKPKSSTVKFEGIVNSHDLRGAFNLNKYLESFLQIRYMFSSTNEHAIFHGEYETTELELILFTPAMFIFPEDASCEYMVGCKIFQANKENQKNGTEMLFQQYWLNLYCCMSTTQKI
ncbi:uncharacterized protein LOC120428443 [Culex pipiens pallens]|nr:uncharacterized protein LOC120428443 [Culex pipiens pallens]